jgi:chloramphenicol 3-O-phosphotransferase
MISQAEQAPDVRLVGSDASDEEVWTRKRRMRRAKRKPSRRQQAA